MPSDERTDHWYDIVATLAEPSREAERAETTLFLRRTQRTVFEELRKAIEDPSVEDVTWRHPILRARIDCDGLGDQQTVQDPETERSVNHLALLTAGALIHRRGGRSFTGLPVSLLDGILRTPRDRARELLEGWMDFEEWVRPVSYGDPFDRESGKGTATLFGSGPRGAGKASLVFEIGPHVIDEDDDETYFEITAGVAWHGEPPPENWSQPETEALWQTIDKLFGSLVSASERNTNLPEKIKVPVEGGAATAFKEFTAALKKPEGPSIVDLASLRKIERTALRNFPDYVLGDKGPVLDLLDRDGQLSLVASRLTYATMLYPAAPRQRQQYFLATCIHQLLAAFPSLIEDLEVEPGQEHLMVADVLHHISPLIEINESSLAELVSAPSHETLMRKSVDLAVAGKDAGQMLLFVLEAAQQHPQHASVNQAAFVRERELMAQARGEGSVEIRRRSQLIHNWKMFRSVAHLWAAYEMSALASKEFSPNQMLDESFLAVAEFLRLRGESIFARAEVKLRGPILDPTQTWRVPSDLTLPQVEIRVPNLSEATLRHLAEYSTTGSHADE